MGGDAVTPIQYMLFGKTGGGKSATGNTLSGKDLFQSVRSQTPVTTESKSCEFNFSMQDFLCVDTPGLFDDRFTDLNWWKKKELYETIVEQFRQALILTSTDPEQRGVNAFVICISARERTTVLEQLLPESLNKLFATDVQKNCVLVVTNVDDFDTREQYDHWYHEGLQTSPSFKALVEFCEGRAFPISNRNAPDWTKSSRSDILNTIAGLPRFSFNKFEENEKEVKRRFQEVADALAAHPEAAKEEGCIGFGQHVTIRDNGLVRLKKIETLTKGEEVLTNTGFSAYVGDLHPPMSAPVIEFQFTNGNNLSVTPDHLVQTGKGDFVLAKQVLVGSYIGTHEVASISSTNKAVDVCAPLTRSGTILVNNVPISCFAYADQWWSRMAYLPITHLGMWSGDTIGYTTHLRAFYRHLPQPLRSWVSVSSVDIP